MKTGLQSLGDVTAGEKLKSSLKWRAQQNLHEIFNTKVPIKRKATEKKISIKRTTKKKGRRDKLIRQRDIFSQNIMTIIPDPKKDHIECSISDTDLLTPAFVQSDIESGRYEDTYPITKLEDNGPTEFVTDNASDRFLDSSNSFLKVKCKITKAGGQNLAETDKVSVIYYSISSLFSQVDILLGAKVVSSSTNTYPYRPYIETLPNYSKEAKETQHDIGFFYKDRAGHLDELDPTGDNTGLNKGHESGKLSKTMFLQGRVHSDIFNQN